MNKILVLDTMTFDEHFQRRSASFYKPVSYYEGRLEEYDGVIVRHTNQKTQETIQSNPILKGDFLSGLQEFSKRDEFTKEVTHGLYYRW